MKKFNRYMSILILCILLVSMTGCASTGYDVAMPAGISFHVEAAAANSEEGGNSSAESASLPVYVVKEGDSLISIAEEYGITVEELVLHNQEVLVSTAEHFGRHFDDPAKYAEYIYVGEELEIPAPQQ